MKKLSQTLAILILGSLLLGCDSDRTDQAAGGVILVITDVSLEPFGISMNNLPSAPFITLEEDIEITSIVANPSGDSTDLMTVEMRTYQVVYTRVDGGTNTPPTYTRSMTGTISPGGNLAITNLPIAGSAQTTNPPLSDLLFENGGFDKETGLDTIVMDVAITFFGQTLSGENVATGPTRWTIEFFQ